MESQIPIIELDAFLPDLDSDEVPEILRRAVEAAVDRDLVTADQCDQIVEELLRREERFSTAIGDAAAVPHAYIEGLNRQVLLLVRLRRAINMGAPDGVPTRFLFVLLGPPGAAGEHLDTLMHIAQLVSDSEFRYEAGRANDEVDLRLALERFIRRVTPDAVAAADGPHALEYTGRLAGGLLGDIKRRLPYFAADFRDGLCAKTVSSTLFLFFACIAPAVTFGGLMYLATDGEMGATQMLLATALCGIVFALLGGQPLIILGGTGPLLVFTGLLYALCADYEIPFLPAYAWVGVWMGVFTLVLAITDASWLIKYFTRFTDEVFAALISAIFIVEAMTSVTGYLAQARVAEVAHDVAFLALIVSLGTFTVAMLLSRFRKSRYLYPTVREFLADFGPTIAVVSMVLFGALFSEVQLPALTVGDAATPLAERIGTVDLFAAPKWVWLAAAGPALLGTVLVYMDQNITARLVNNPDHRLQKGEAYHLDLAVVGALIVVCSCLGLPWLVAATVRSLNHVRSLAVAEEVVTRGGDRREQIIHVVENRMSGLGIHILIGLSLLLLPLLQLVPMAVLYGLFLYMGVVSLAGNQFFERLTLWLTDPDLYPSTHYIRRVPRDVIHRFTLIQLVCLLVLWIVKVTPAGIVFPLVIALVVPVRMLIGRYFLAEHLAVLDADEDPEEEESTWV